MKKTLTTKKHDLKPDNKPRPNIFVLSINYRRKKVRGFENGGKRQQKRKQRKKI